MEGNWIACSEGERRRATHHSPIGFSESVAWKAIFKRWMPRVRSLIHAESTSRSLSHPLQSFCGAGWWLLNGVAVRGPSHLWGNDQSLPHLEILRTVTEGSGRNGSLWECGIRGTGAAQFSEAGLRNTFGRQWDANVVCYQHVQAECADEVNNHCTATCTPTDICIPCSCENNTFLHRNPFMLQVVCLVNKIYWHFDALKYIPQLFLSCNTSIFSTLP